MTLAAGRSGSAAVIGEFLSALGWNDVLDFGILLIIFYGTLRLLRGTRAVPVLLAVAFIATLMIMAKAIHLVAVAVLIDKFIDYIIIVLIVVFHQEIRRILLHVGQQLTPRGRRKAAESAVGELVLALERLRRAKIGALFVLQGEIDVVEVASDSGREIDGTLRADTLVALMIPHPINLAHDGAVLIREFRIERAGLICPLTDRENLDPQFGTRHRGALGITEETDALAIIVSEERGEIRLAHRGQLSEPLVAAKLEERVTAWIERPGTDAVLNAAVSGRQRIDSGPGESSARRRVESTGLGGGEGSGRRRVESTGLGGGEGSARRRVQETGLGRDVGEPVKEAR
ncbi:MAG: diadenylate cyclase [Nannocystaceae bacterium]